jgi:hypothetical protein
VGLQNLQIRIGGYFGAGNIGDGLLLRAPLAVPAESGAEAAVIGMNPEHTPAYYLVKTIPFHDFPALARGMSEVDAVVPGGGGLFQDHHRFTVPDLYQYPGPGAAYFAQISLPAQQFGIPTIPWAMGAGPLKVSPGRTGAPGPEIPPPTPFTKGGQNSPMVNSWDQLGNTPGPINAGLRKHLWQYFCTC